MKKRAVIAIAMLALVLFLGFGGLFIGESHTSSTAIGFVHADNSSGGGTNSAPPCPKSDPGCDD